MTRTEPRRVRVTSRNNRDLTATYPELAELGAVLGERGAVVDGEIVSLDSAGRWYRIVHGENTIDWLSLADVERILGEAGVDLTLLREAGPAA